MDQSYFSRPLRRPEKDQTTQRHSAFNYFSPKANISFCLLGLEILLKKGNWLPIEPSLGNREGAREIRESTQSPSNRVSGHSFLITLLYFPRNEVRVLQPFNQVPWVNPDPSETSEATCPLPGQPFLSQEGQYILSEMLLSLLDHVEPLHPHPRLCV